MMCKIHVCTYVSVCVRLYVLVHAGGRGFESHLSSLFYENRKEGSYAHYLALPL